MSPLPGAQLATQRESLYVYGERHFLQRLARAYTLRAAVVVLLLVASIIIAAYLPGLLGKKDEEIGLGEGTTTTIVTELPQAPSVSAGPSGPVVPGFKPGGRPPTAALGIPDPVPDLEAEAPTIASQTEMGMPIDPNGIEGLGGGGGGGWGSPNANLDGLISGPIDSLLSPDAYVAVEQQPIPVSIPKPEYPRLARDAEVEGTVLVRALVGTDGKVRKTMVIKGPEALTASAASAVLRGQFKPALQNNRPVAVWVVVPINFSLR